MEPYYEGAVGFLETAVLQSGTGVVGCTPTWEHHLSYVGFPPVTLAPVLRLAPYAAAILCYSLGIQGSILSPTLPMVHSYLVP